MYHHRNVEFLDELPERTRFIVIRIMSLVAGMDENAFETEFANGPLGLLDEGRSSARQDCRETVKHTLVLVLHFGRAVGPALDGGKLLAIAFAAQIMSGIGHHTDVDACLVMSVQEIFEHHRAAVFAPRRAALTVESPLVVGRFFRRVDMGMPIDDHNVSSLDLGRARFVF
jgi:hypothetical protein